MQHRFQLIALDLDGTLTNSDKVITPDTFAALMRAQKEGVRLALASGRPTYGIMPLARQLRMEEYGGYILSYNGGKIIECLTQRILSGRTLPADRLHLVFDLAKQYRLAALTYENESILTEHPEDAYVRLEAQINHLAIRQVVHLNEAVYFPVVKCLIVGEGQYLASVEGNIREELGSGFDVYRSAPYFLEIVPAGVNKGAALRQLLDRLHLGTDQLMAFGDGYNDGTMIDCAGLGIVMENGVQELRRRADFITRSNDEDGIAYALQRFLFSQSGG